MTRAFDPTITAALRENGPATSGSPFGTLHADAVPFGIASVVVTCFLWSAQDAPLPATGWAAAFLFLACFEDVRSLRIPNWLTAPSLIAAFAIAGITDGTSGMLVALAGAALSFAFLFIPFALRLLGAGDVKAAMVLGALWSSEHIGPALWWMVVMGGVMAIALVAARPPGLSDLLRRWWQSLRMTVATGRLTYFGPAPESIAASGLPFAVAMALGATALQLWGPPWV